MSVHRELPLSKRRNGKQASCEPCRKAKLACDHALPVCGRCLHRKTNAQCIYHPAPMTGTGIRKRVHVIANPSQGETTPHTSPNPISAFSHSEVPAQSNGIERRVSFMANTGIGSTTSSVGSGPVTLYTDSGSPQISLITSTIPETLSDHSKRQGSGILLKESSGFYGPTSFASVFLENQDNFASSLDDVGENGEEGAREPWYPTFVNGIPAIHAPASIRLDMGSRILSQLPNRDVCQRLINTHYWPTSPIPHHVLAEYIFTSTWLVHGAYLKEPRDPRGLATLAKQVFLNEQVPLQPNNSSIKYLESFTGHKLRWESIGLMFTFFGITALALQDRDKLFTTQPEELNDRKKFAICMKQCSEACLVLCDHTDTINDIVLCLLSRLLTLQSIVDGDTSYLLWRRHGELVAALTALGIHREVDPGAKPVSFFSELRKRIFIHVYIVDKSISSFSGRPPLLTRRYTTCPPPLDLSDQCLIAEDEEEMRREVSQLDENGWNIHGDLHPATCSRAFMIFAQVREDVLEISLCTSTEPLKARIDAVKQRSKLLYKDIPPSLIDNTDNIACLTKSDQLLYIHIHNRLRILQNNFLLEQISTTERHSSGQELLDTARQILATIVIIWVQRDRLVEYHHNFTWLITCYGVSSGGVLCIEMLKQIKSTHNSQLHLPRSEVIQNLSMLIGFLAWVRPTVGDYVLCERMRKIFQHVLDRVLEPEREEEQNSTQPAFQGLGAQDDFMNFSMGDTEFVDWLDTIDWGKGPWMDLSRA